MTLGMTLAMCFGFCLPDFIIEARKKKEDRDYQGAFIKNIIFCIIFLPIMYLLWGSNW